MRYPCDRFAAFLAHSLNSEELLLLRVDAGALYSSLTLALTTRYSQLLLHHQAYAWRMSSEEAALRYFDASLGRRLQLTGSVDLSVAHHLFIALCLRGADAGWDTASLSRAHRGNDSNVTALSTQASFDQCSQRLSRLPDTLSSGSASKSIRTRRGNIVLHVGARQTAVPEELSIWDAITCAPDTLRALPAGEPFNRFCGRVIDSVRTAHRPIQDLLGLGRGLCPFDWLDTLSSGQVRAIRKFLDHVEGKDTPAQWSLAWEHSSVPQFDNAADLWQSEIGLALRRALAIGAVSIDALKALPAAEEDIEFLAENEFREQLYLLETDGIISPLERFLLAQLYRGTPISELARLPEVKDELRRRGMTFAKLCADVQRRVGQWNGGETST